MNKHALVIIAALALSMAAADAQTATTLTGKVVDLATYVTHDHNMDAMKGDAMKGDAMKDDAMKGDAMKSDAMKGDAMKGDAMATSSCPASLGLVTSTGRVYLLATQMGSAQAQALCKQVGRTASVAGAVFTQGGLTALLVK